MGVGAGVGEAGVLVLGLVVVMGAYLQIQAQKKPVLQDVDEDNFDRAFHLLRPGADTVLLAFATNPLTLQYQFFAVNPMSATAL